MGMASEWTGGNLLSGTSGSSNKESDNGRLSDPIHQDVTDCIYISSYAICIEHKLAKISRLEGVVRYFLANLEEGRAMVWANTSHVLIPA